MSDKVEKAVLAETIENSAVKTDLEIRGINVYHMTDLMNQSARTRRGEMSRGPVQRPLFSLAIQDRIEMFDRASMLQGVITGRAKRIASMKWKITQKTKDDDRLIANLKDAKEYYDELSPDDITMAVKRYALAKNIISVLPEVLPDLSNFNSALRRYKRKNQRVGEDRATEIEEWIKTPNNTESFRTFLHKAVIDLMVHGAADIYKELNGRELDNFYLLPGGTIFPYRSAHVGGPSAFFQIIPSMEAKLYFDDEIARMTYVPVSWQSYGVVPFEALINKVAETLFFDRRSAEQADGTKPPEKAIIFSKTPSPFGGLTQLDFDMPMDTAEQKRIESKLNEARKEAIMTLSGVGNPTVMDLSRSETYGQQQQRQDKLLRDIALIYNMTNMEVNLAGGEFTSGKETSDVQQEIEQQKGIGPILLEIEEIINRKILPWRYGYDYEFKFDIEPSESDQVELDNKKVSGGTYSVNEIREKRGDDPWPEEQYDRPKEGGQQPPDGSETNPLNMRSL